MRYGIDVPIFGDYFDSSRLGDLAYEAEQSGWDGFFVWDHLTAGGSSPTVDPWVALAVIATRTKRVRIGPMVTPIPRRRPWKLARETVSIDHLSGGRLVLGVGLGSPADAEFERFGEDGNVALRAGKLDEGLDVLTGLWSGEPFSYNGRHYRLTETVFQPPPAQSPRIPIWVGAMWPNRAPLRRAARWDGVFPIYLDGGNKMTPEIMRTIVAYTGMHRTEGRPFDAIVGGPTPFSDRDEEAGLVARYADAGVTWYISPFNESFGSFDECRARIRQGPPRFE